MAHYLLERPIGQMREIDESLFSEEPPSINQWAVSIAAAGMWSISSMACGDIR